MLELAYHKISAVFPRKLVQFTARLLNQCGFEGISARIYLGFALFFSLSFALISFFVSPFITNITVLQAAAPFIGFILSAFAFYLLLLLRSDSRAQQVEFVLPEVLQIISANIRAGMTLENAIWTAARPEFGPLRDEIKKVSADTFGGVPISESLSKMPLRVRSAILDRSIRLIVEGIKLGGEMAKLLDEVAADIRSVQLLRKEIATSTMMYVIFILFAAVLAAPVLYGISSFYSEMNEKVTAKRNHDTAKGPDLKATAAQAGLGGIATLGMGGSQKAEGSINSQDIFWFSIASLTITNLFAALTLGLIQHGKATRGVKFIPIFIPASLGIYFLVLTGLRLTLGSFMK